MQRIIYKTERRMSGNKKSLWSLSMHRLLMAGAKHHFTDCILQAYINSNRTNSTPDCYLFLCCSSSFVYHNSINKTYGQHHNGLKQHKPTKPPKKHRYKDGREKQDQTNNF